MNKEELKAFVEQLLQQGLVRTAVQDILREQLGTYLATDAQLTLPRSVRLLPPNAFIGTLGSKDGSAGAYGKTTLQANAIAPVSSAPSSYSQAQLQTVVDAVNALRTALSNFGITKP